MTSWRKAVGLGVLVWLVPFVVAVAIFPIRESSRPLFESIMAVAVTATAAGFGLLYMKRVTGGFAGEALRVGILWLVISIAIDAPRCCLAGPCR